MFHDEHTIGAIHIPYNYLYADAAEREAATDFVAGDVGKLARQEDDNSIWMLTDDDPATWVRVGASDGAVELVDPPAAFNSAGAPGQIAVDAFYLYVFRASDSRWPRVALESDW